MSDISKKRLRLSLSLASFLVVIPAILFLGVFLGDRNYGATGAAIVIFALVPFFLLFENKKVRARELVPIAVMTAIAVVSRMAFFFLPQFKPVVAVVIITGVAFGAEAGFLSGSLSMLCSNFFFGQGPWTPWQMFACGIIGYIAGFFGKSAKLKKTWVLAIFGFFSGFLYGLFVDGWTILGYGGDVTWEKILLTYTLGLPFNAVLALATCIFLVLCAKPLLEKLDRIKIKYGLIPAGGGIKEKFAAKKERAVTGFSPQPNADAAIDASNEAAPDVLKDAEVKGVTL